MEGNVEKKLKCSSTNMWNCVKTVKPDMSSAPNLKMLLEGVYADINIDADGGSVNVHRCVLANISPVFDAMFRSNMQEQNTSVVTMPDMKIEPLKIFLVLLYCGPGNVKEECMDQHCLEIIAACQKYQVDHLLDACASSLKRILTDDNCWEYMTEVKKYLPPNATMKAKEPYNVCYSYIVSNFSRIVDAESFFSAIKTYPALVTQMTRCAVGLKSKSTFYGGSSYGRR